MKIATRITALLSGAAVLAALGVARFARSVFESMVGAAGGGVSALPNPSVFAFNATQPLVLALLGALGVGGIVGVEVFLKAEERRLLVQTVVLLVTVCWLTTTLLGFFLPFHIPSVVIP